MTAISTQASRSMCLAACNARLCSISQSIPTATAAVQARSYSSI
ncbi:hypothetical protein [Actinoallomurus sp. NPDC050550]